MRRLIDWIDTHPRTLAYVAVVVTADFILNLIRTLT